MRRYSDRRGRSWDVLVGRESFGAFYAIFVPAAGNPEAARQALLEADSQLRADAELGELTESQLHDLLERSEPKV